MVIIIKMIVINNKVHIIKISHNLMVEKYDKMNMESILMAKQIL